MKQFFGPRATIFLRKSFRISLVLSVAVFTFTRMIFYELPFSLEDILLFAKIVGAGFAATLFCGVSFYVIIAVIKELTLFLLNPVYRKRNMIGRIIRMVHLPNDFFEAGAGDRSVIV